MVDYELQLSGGAHCVEFILSKEKNNSYVSSETFSH